MAETADTRIGVVVGMASEALLLKERGPDVAVAVTGARPERAKAVAERLVDEGATALLSFGLAGGLDPALGAGALIIPETVLVERERFETDPGWRRAWAAAVPEIGAGSLLAVTRGIIDPAEKERLYRETGAAAVDMESGGVAQVAARRQIPFCAVRAIADTAGQAVPAYLLEVLREDGKPDPGKLFRGLLWRPWTLLALMRLGRASVEAHRSLLAVLEATVPKVRTEDG